MAMTIKRNLIMAVTASMIAGILLAGCSGGLKILDVVGRQSVTSFNEVLQALPGEVEADELNAGWALSAPDGSVRFIWSEDYSKAPMHDVMLEFDAKPFLDAGLDPDRLPDNYFFYESAAMGGMNGMGSRVLMVGTKLGDDVLSYSENPTALAAYEQIVDKYRSSINYHTSLDHFGVMLGNGNMFEWAKDMSTNSYDNSNQDKDIVFVLNPEPFISAGTDPENIDGWVYAQVEVEESGKKVQVWKLLKPFNLK